MVQEGQSMKFEAIFDVFSRRSEETDIFVYEVSETLRYKIVFYCHDVVSGRLGSPIVGRGSAERFWSEIHRDGADDVEAFLLTCRDEEFLDFVEYIFRVESLVPFFPDVNEFVHGINELFASENVGYELTEMVTERVVETADEYPFFGREVEKIKVVSRPQIIRKENQVAQAQIVKPVLKLLSGKRFKAANKEYLEALEDYRKGDYGDCLTKCGSAFESVMKIICDDKGWSYQQTDTASTLIGTMISNTNLDPFFE
jgi:hypothetical protein